MGKIKRKMADLPLRQAFVGTVFCTFCIVLILSGLVIGLCSAFRHYLLPDSNAVYLTIEKKFSDGTTTVTSHLLNYGEEAQTSPYLEIEGKTSSEATSYANSDSDDISLEASGDTVLGELGDTAQGVKYSIQKIENSYETLTPKRKLAYQGCGVIMIAFPVLFSIVGILVCGFYFYRKKLETPIQLLAGATEEIAAQNLDFSLEYDGKDEMGLLCDSFEQMRKALYENNKIMWNLLEEQKLLQASVAHDLRNPIAIIEGYTEYLEMNLSEGKLNQERIQHIARNLNMAAKRLEHYTESVRTVNQMEDIEVNPQEVSAAELADDMLEDFKIMGEKNHISLQRKGALSGETIRVDTAVLYRILENILGNAIRFARKEVSLEFTVENHMLSVVIADDGPGFPGEILAKKEKLFLPAAQEDGHMGIGITVSRLLCKKHGGSLKLSNSGTQGAVVEINLAV